MKIPFKLALVTGGAGFIGSHLVEALVGGGCAVLVLDDLSTGRLANLADVRDRIRFQEGDVRDARQVEHIAQGCDVVFHQAAVVSVPKSVEDPVASATVNEMGTLHVLEAARKHAVKRVVLASSCAVFGNDPRIPKTEDSVISPESPYALQKRVAERYAELYWKLYGTETACLRYFNVYGPRQDPSSPYSGVISIFMTQAAAGTEPVIYGDGNQTRDFVFVKDIVNANLLAATQAGAAGRVFNIGTGNAVTINRLWESICRLAGCRIPPRYEAPRQGDIVASVAGIDAAKRMLGFKPECSFEQGLSATYRWYRASLGQKS